MLNSSTTSLGAPVLRGEMVEGKGGLTFAVLRALPTLKTACLGVGFILLVGKLRKAQRGDVTYPRSHSNTVSSPVLSDFSPHSRDSTRKLAAEMQRDTG